MAYAEPAPNLILSTRARRRARTTPEQQALLVQYYETVTTKPSLDVCNNFLRRRTGIEGQSVYYWFQNRRSKMQRERQQQERRGRSLSPHRQSSEAGVTASSPQTYVTATSPPINTSRTQPPRLPPVSSLMPMSGSAFTPTTPGAGAAVSSAARKYHPAYQDTAAPPLVTRPGTAEPSPIPFYFHHASFGVEANMLQMLQLREQRKEQNQHQQHQHQQHQQQQQPQSQK